MSRGFTYAVSLMGVTGVREPAAYADGVIVGTAIVGVLRDGSPTPVGRLTAELRAGLAQDRAST